MDSWLVGLVNGDGLTGALHNHGLISRFSSRTCTEVSGVFKTLVSAAD